VSEASLSSAITSGPINDGSIQLSVSLAATEALITLSGSGIGAAADVYVHVFAEVDAAIPQIGDAMTPVFLSLEELTESGARWSVRSIAVTPARLPPGPACPVPSVRATPHSAQLGSPVGDASGYYSLYDVELGPWPARTTNPLHLLPGETVRIPIEITIQLAHAQSVSGSGDTFSDSAKLVFRVSPTTIGNGDVNGDAQVNVVDTTLIRRALAGFPNP
jgi:hypothetical protein